MSDEFGSGVYLDEQFDFSVGPSGDLETTSGLDELQKDLAVQMSISLQQFLGRPPSGNLKAKVANVSRTIALEDNRIRSIISDTFSVEFSNDRKQLSVSFDVRTESGSQELVFNI